MIGNKRLLAIIPARGRSKRLPRKNILDFSGKPLIAWTIEAALNSKYIDRVVVSTDDQEIADVSKKYGAELPFVRPDNLATDEATSIDVVLQLLEQLEVDDEYSRNWFKNVKTATTGIFSNLYLYHSCSKSFPSSFTGSNLNRLLISL